MYLGVMPDGIPIKCAGIYNPSNRWKILLPGEEIRRGKHLQRHAITSAEIKFSNEDNLQKFFEIIKESDDKLSKIPDSEVMYEWQMISRKGLTVRFGVAWLDKDFYSARKDAYMSNLHSKVFKQFNISAKDIRIEHIPL